MSGTSKMMAGNALPLAVAIVVASVCTAAPTNYSPPTATTTTVPSPSSNTTRDAGLNGRATTAPQECGVMRQLQEMPFNMEVLPGASDDWCPCQSDERYHLEQLSGFTAQVPTHEMPATRNCPWTWSCRHSLTRFPHIFFVAKLDDILRGDECSVDGEIGSCEAIYSKEMVLRQVMPVAEYEASEGQEVNAAALTQQSAQWGISLDDRRVGYVCIVR